MDNIEFKVIENKNIENKNIVFGYIENETYAMYVFLKKSSKIIDNEILEKLLQISFEMYSDKLIYSKKELDSIIFDLNQYVQDYIEEKEEYNINISYLCVYTDYNSIYFNLVGDFKLSYIRDENLYIEDLTNEEYLGKNNILISSLKYPVLLKQLDKIVVISKNLDGKINIFNIDENIEREDNFLLATILIKETKNESLYYKSNKIYYILMLIIFSVIIYIFLNSYIISYKYNKINELDKEFKELISNGNLSLSINKIKNELDMLKNLDESYLYFSKKESLKKEKLMIEKESIYNLALKVKEYLKTIELTKKEIEKREFEKVLDTYLIIKNKLEEYDENFNYFKLNIQKEIENMKKLIEIKSNENKLKKTKESYFEDLNILNEIIYEYTKVGYKIDVSDLINFKIELENSIDEIKRHIDDEIIQARILKSENISQSKRKYEDILIMLENVKDDIKREEINKELEELNTEIKYNEDELNRNFKQYEIEYDLKNYKISLDYLMSAKHNAEILKNFEKQKEINSRINYIRKIVRKNETNKMDLKIKKDEDIRIRNEKKKTVVSSIEQGDEYLKNNEYSKAYTEYIRALEIIEKEKFDEYKKDLNKKILYVKNKINKKWWEIWK
ncbi:hypothetical protein [Pseudostreptobacillus hongkongensis]|uniref:hypothetical protein n=1 Tax=Pseudostreptobacillus hongkongensis TaxID=1162717 RepID=UPI00082BE0E4|nr:hypothetical protein [Pseudostreptobacillus hongkongensis]